jgi:hypothetical protein
MMARPLFYVNIRLIAIGGRARIDHTHLDVRVARVGSLFPIGTFAVNLG